MDLKEIEAQIEKVRKSNKTKENKERELEKLEKLRIDLVNKSGNESENEEQEVNPNDVAIIAEAMKSLQRASSEINMSLRSFVGSTVKVELVQDKDGKSAVTTLSLPVKGVNVKITLEKGENDFSKIAKFLNANQGWAISTDANGNLVKSGVSPNLKVYNTHVHLINGQKRNLIEAHSNGLYSCAVEEGYPRLKAVSVEENPVETQVVN